MLSSSFGGGRLTWHRSENSEVVVSLSSSAKDFQAGLVVESLFYISASSHIPSRVSRVRGANKPWQQPRRKAWKTSSSEELNGKLLA